MRHDFEIWDHCASDQAGMMTRKRFHHSSTLIASGQSKASGGHSIMSTTVGKTCAIATRLVLEGKIKKRGVLSPIHAEIYEPILD